MKACILVAFFGLSGGLASQIFAQSKDTADSRVASQLVSFYDSALHLKYEEAFNEKNAAALAALFTEDGFLAAPEGLFSGRPSIEKWYAQVFERSRLSNFFIVRDQLNAIGDELWAVGRWSSLLNIGNAPVPVGGHWAEIYIRDGNEWKIRLSIFNLAPKKGSSPTICP
ncbi:MAG TPA: nuclear transport factor 2 family protein [Terrimicrobiaceae bacterium]